MMMIQERTPPFFFDDPFRDFLKEGQTEKTEDLKDQVVQVL